MEIEAKFNVPNAKMLAHLDALQQIAGFSVLPGKTKHLQDCYLDTVDRRIFANGYALRRRRQDDGDWVISLKGLGGADGAIHRREELETKVVPQLADQAPETWKQSQVYAQLQQMLGSATLNLLFCLSQKRITHRLADANRIVAEMSLDEVHLTINGTETTFFEMEAELKADGTEDDLRKIVAFLQENFFLLPEPRSKFERALAQFDAPRKTNRILSPAERAVLSSITAVNARTDTYSRRAQALLAIDEGISGIVAAERADLSERQVRHWRSEFGKAGVGIFPDRILEKALYPAPPPKLAILGQAPIAISARRILWQQRQLMVYHELAARLGHRVDDVSAMLNAVRGLLIAIEALWADFSSAAPPDTSLPEKLATLLEDLRRTMLWQQHAETFLHGASSLSLSNLRQQWLNHQQIATDALNDFLDSDSFRQWLEDFSTGLQLADPAQSPHSAETRRIFPAYLYRYLATALGAASAESAPSPAATEAALARLNNYAVCLSVFGDVLGKSKNRLAKLPLTLAENLDELYHRQSIAAGLHRYLAFGVWDAPADAEPAASPPTDATTVAAYSATIAAEISQLQTKVIQLLAKFNAKNYWQTVANVVKRL